MTEQIEVTDAGYKITPRAGTDLRYALLSEKAKKMEHPAFRDEKELNRRKKLLQKLLPSVQERQLRDSVSSALRSEWAYGISGDGRRYIEVKGAHPGDYLQNQTDRDLYWEEDFQGVLDKITLIDRRHDAFFLGFVSRVDLPLDGNSNGNKNPAHTMIIASRGASQLADGDMIKKIMDFREVITNGVVIPLAASQFMRRHIQEEMTKEMGLLPALDIEARFPINQPAIVAANHIVFWPAFPDYLNINSPAPVDTHLQPSSEASEFTDDSMDAEKDTTSIPDTIGPHGWTDPHQALAAFEEEMLRGANQEWERVRVWAEAVIAARGPEVSESSKERSEPSLFAGSNPDLALDYNHRGQFELADAELERRFAAITPDTIAERLIEDPYFSLMWLGGLKLDEVFSPRVSVAFTALLSSSMKACAILLDLSFRQTIFLYAIFKQDIVSIDDQQRVFLLKKHLRMDYDLAYFIVETVADEKEADVQVFLRGILEGEEVPGLGGGYIVPPTTYPACENALAMFGLPDGLAAFARSRTLRPFSVGWLAALFGFPNVRKGETRLIELLTEGFDISLGFANFLLAQFSKEIPDNWR